METSLIRVATEVLAAKESQMRRLSTDIYGAIQYNFNAAPVDTAYDTLHEKWVEHRVELTTTIDRIANILRDIRAAWEAAEEQMVAGIDGGGAGT